MRRSPSGPAGPRPADARPATGTHARPATGTHARPATGTHARPATGTHARPNRPATGTHPRPPRPAPSPVAPLDPSAPDPSSDWAKAIGTLMQLKGQISKLVVELGDKSVIVYKNDDDD